MKEGNESESAFKSLSLKINIKEVDIVENSIR